MREVDPTAEIAQVGDPMVGLQSVFTDHSAPGPLSTHVTPPPPPTGSSDHLEAVLRSLFDQVAIDGSSSGGSMSGGLGIKVFPGPSPGLISVEFSDALTRLICELCGSANDGGNRDRVEGVVCRLLNEKMAKEKLLDGAAAGGSGPGGVLCSSDGSSGSISDVLMCVKGVAASPCDLVPPMADELREKWGSILGARRAMFLQAESVPEDEDLPYRLNSRKKQKIYRNLCETSISATNSSEKPDTSLSNHQCSFYQSVPLIHDQKDPVRSSKFANGVLNQPKRRSERSLGLLKLAEIGFPRTRVPIGPSFQAYVPEWTDLANSKTNLNDDKRSYDSKWLGTQLWPIENDNRKKNMKLIGKGSSDLCSCNTPRSIMCIRYHVRNARLDLKFELGPAFISMGFDNMGEEVSNMWSWHEQMAFDALVRLNPISQDKTFWYHALRCFSSKSRQNIASYYFNVHVLRRMSFQTKLAKESVDSDDDEWAEQPYEALLPTCSRTRHRKRNS